MARALLLLLFVSLLLLAPPAVAGAQSQPHEFQPLGVWRDGSNTDEPLALKATCRIPPEDAGPPEYLTDEADIEAYLPRRMRVRGKLRWIHLGGGLLNECDDYDRETDAGQRFPHWVGLGLGLDPSAELPSGRLVPLPPRRWKRAIRAARRMKLVRIKAALDPLDGRAKYRSVHRVPVRGWTYYCDDRRSVESHTPDPSNQPPVAWVGWRGLTLERCELEVEPVSHSAGNLVYSYDPEGSGLSATWLVDGQVVREDPPVQARSYGEAARNFRSLSLNLGTGERPRRVEVVLRDEGGAWTKVALTFTPRSSRVPLRRWPE